MIDLAFSSFVTPLKEIFYNTETAWQPPVAKVLWEVSQNLDTDGIVYVCLQKHEIMVNKKDLLEIMGLKNIQSLEDMTKEVYQSYKHPIVVLKRV